MGGPQKIMRARKRPRPPTVHIETLPPICTKHMNLRCSVTLTTVKKTLLTGVCMGFALGAKLSAVPLIPIYLAGLLVPIFRKKANISTGKTIGWFALSCLSTLIILNLIYADFGSMPLAQGNWQSRFFTHLRDVPLISSIPLPLPDVFLRGLDLQALFRSDWPLIFIGQSHQQ